MKNAKTIDLFLYWNRLRNGRPCPRRSEVEPADIKSILADSFILETDQRNQPVFRLAGTRLCAAFGRELKGFVFTSLWSDRDQRLVARLTKNAFHDACVVVVTFEGRSAKGRTCLFEMLLLPLEGDTSGARALGSITQLERPFWLGIDPIAESAIRSIRIVDPDREPMFLKNRPEMDVPALSPVDALENTAFDPPEGRRIRHLVVMDGGLAGRRDDISSNDK